MNAGYQPSAYRPVAVNILGPCAPTHIGGRVPLCSGGSKTASRSGKNSESRSIGEPSESKSARIVANASMQRPTGFVQSTP